MACTSLLADTLTRIRNAQMAKHAFTVVSFSVFGKNVLKVLKNEGYIEEFTEFEERKNIKKIKVDLKYIDGNPVIRELNLISKPGRRVYKSVAKLDSVYGGLGIVILSTPQGVITDNEAKKLNVGGEVLCNVF